MTPLDALLARARKSRTHLHESGIRAKVVAGWTQGRDCGTADDVLALSFVCGVSFREAMGVVLATIRDAEKPARESPRQEQAQ